MIGSDAVTDSALVDAISLTLADTSTPALSVLIINVLKPVIQRLDARTKMVLLNEIIGKHTNLISEMQSQNSTYKEKVTMLSERVLTSGEGH